MGSPMYSQDLTILHFWSLSAAALSEAESEWLALEPQDACVQSNRAC